MELTTNYIRTNGQRYKNLIHNNNNKVYNSPIVLYRNFIKCFFLKENIINKNKDYLNLNSKRSKSEKNSSLNSFSKSHKYKKYIAPRKTYNMNKAKNNAIKQNSVNIHKKITYYTNDIKKSENKKIITTSYTKERRLTNPLCNINNIKQATKTENKNHIYKINKSNKSNNITGIKKLQINNSKKKGYKKLMNPSSKVCISLDNILSKNTINKYKTKIKANSYDKNKPIIINKSTKINLKRVENKLKTEKISKNKKYTKTVHNQIKSEKMNSKKIKNIYRNNKMERNVVNLTKNYKRDINNYKKYDSNNNSKLISDNVSTNYKSINSKNQIKTIKNNINPTPNINNIKNKKNVKFIRKFNINNNNTLRVIELMKENDAEEKINGVKINNFDINKPKDENLKFTFAKEDKQIDLSVSCASKVIIGKIEGYRDIIETDQEKNHFKLYSNLYNKKINKFNLSNYLSNSNKNSNRKINNCSNILKKENDSITFNDDEFNENLNLSNNWDGMSSTNTNNKITGIKIEKNNYDYNNDSYYLKSENGPENDFIISERPKNSSKKDKNNLIDINKNELDKKKKMVQNSDNCIII